MLPLVIHVFAAIGLASTIVAVLLTVRAVRFIRRRVRETRGDRLAATRAMLERYGMGNPPGPPAAHKERHP